MISPSLDNSRMMSSLAHVVLFPFPPPLVSKGEGLNLARYLDLIVSPRQACNFFLVPAVMVAAVLI